MNLLRASGAAAVVIAMTAFPTAALAVNVSSNDGAGYQDIQTRYPCAAQMDGKLRSTFGNPVYYSGNRVYDNDFDEVHGRYTTDTTSSQAVQKGGLLGPSTSQCATPQDGYQMKICRNKNNQPDSCGGYSAVIR